MLKQRVLTAIILIPLFVGLVLKLPPRGFCLLTSLLVVVSAIEWSGLMGIKGFPKSIIFPFLMIILIVNGLYLLATHVVSVPEVMYVAFAFWIIAAFWVFSYPKTSNIWGKGVLVRGIMGILVLMPCWLALNFIRVLPSGEYILLALFVLIWGADTGAYFAGKKWGKHKIIPIVSPGKSWEGLAGALITTVLLVFCILTSLKFPTVDIWALLVLSLVTVLFSVLGDLFESMLKRKVDLKDSGAILPGHGGILDRIDSLTAAAPIFALGLILMAK
jgi:phosphatidate cytidylyltransferase